MQGQLTGHLSELGKQQAEALAEMLDKEELDVIVWRFDPRYRDVPEAELPRTESLLDTVGRIMPYWKCEILPALARHDSLLVVAHGNSLRGIIKHLKGISDEAISEFNLPTAVPYVFEFDDGLNYVRDYFLGDPEEIAALMAAVADQGRK